MRLKKKSDLSLSINAIVILVLAISMLGLGLGFTKSMFAKFGAGLKVPEPENPATEGDPIAVPSTSIEGKDEKAFGFAVSVYNEASDVATVDLTISCGGDFSTTKIPYGGFEDVNIEPKSAASAKFLVPPHPVGDKGVCTIIACFNPSGLTCEWSLTKQVSLVVE